MTYDPDWDPWLYEIRRMPEVEIQMGDDLVKAHTLNGMTYYILRKDFTPAIEWYVNTQNPNAPYIQLERNGSVN